MEAADQLSRTEPAYRSGRRNRRQGAARRRRHHLARPQARDHRPQSDAFRYQRPAQPRRRAPARLRRGAPARWPTADDFPRCDRKRQLPARARRAQRCADHRRSLEGRLRPERLLRTALAAHQYHRLFGPPGLARCRSAHRPPARLYRLYPGLERHPWRVDRQHSRPRDGRCRHRRTAPRAAGRCNTGRKGPRRARRDLSRNQWRHFGQSQG